jgi:hypothetical protein
MLKAKERQLVLDFLYQECVVASQVPSEVLKRTGCMLEAKMKYESMSTKERVEIYSELLDEEIKKYLMYNIDHSLTFDWVNGCPEKRKIRIQEYVANFFCNMSRAEKVAICEKLGFVYIS